MCRLGEGTTALVRGVPARRDRHGGARPCLPSRSVPAMKYDDVVGMVTTSGVSDWQQIDGGRFFIYELGEYSSAEGRGVSVEYHHSLGVYRGDVGLRLAWGLEEDRDLQFEGMSFPDKQIWRCFADAFWQGALVARWRYLLVDGGRCSLPEVHQAYDGVEEHPGDPAKWTFRRAGRSSTVI